MGEIDVNYVTFKGYVAKIWLPSNGLRAEALSILDSRTTLTANNGGKTSYEDGRNLLVSLQQQLKKDVLNLDELAESLKSLDEG